MSVTPEIRDEILKEHEKNPARFSPFRVASRVGATVAEVRAVINAHLNMPVGDFSGDIARTGLSRFIVASRRVTEPGWNNEDEGVVAARRGFEAGTHDMATHREGAWLHLCSFPLLRQRRARPGYFA